MDESNIDGKEVIPSVQCCRCHRQIALGSRGVGDTITCPFCDTVSVIRERVFLVSEPLERA
ncbi:hypothetical protein KDL29_10525 [bacterium]|nr:hypothetical protein [bacterium]MCB1222182.1 hypothetical protein [bacterium]UNM07980.1 MAG: hypothetical protein H7A35_14150 [Planctomycetales bacterium]